VKQKFKKQERTKYKTHTGLYTCKQAKAQNILRPTVSPEVNARIPSRVWEIRKMPVIFFCRTLYSYVPCITVWK